MSNPTVAQEALPIAVGTTYLGFLIQLPPEAVLGAFTGAVIFLLGATHKPKWQWLLLFTAAFLTGVLGGSYLAALGTAALRSITGLDITIPLGMGAMASAACIVNVVEWLRDNPNIFFRHGQHKESKE